MASRPGFGEGHNSDPRGGVLAVVGACMLAAVNSPRHHDFRLCPQRFLR